MITLMVTLTDVEVARLHPGPGHYKDTGSRKQKGLERIREMVDEAAKPWTEGVELYFRSFDENLGVASIRLADPGEGGGPS